MISFNPTVVEEILISSMYILLLTKLDLYWNFIKTLLVWNNTGIVIEFCVHTVDALGKNGVVEAGLLISVVPV